MVGRRASRRRRTDRFAEDLSINWTGLQQPSQGLPRRWGEVHEFTSRTRGGPRPALSKCSRRVHLWTRLETIVFSVRVLNVGESCLTATWRVSATSIRSVPRGETAIAALFRTMRGPYRDTRGSLLHPAVVDAPSVGASVGSPMPTAVPHRRARCVGRRAGGCATVRTRSRRRRPDFARPDQGPVPTRRDRRVSPSRRACPRPR